MRGRTAAVALVVGAVVSGAGALVGLAIAAASMIGVSVTATDQRSGEAATDCLGAVLATIRAVESGGRYDLPPGPGGASGAYQILDSTWASWAASAGVDTSAVPSAYLAAPAVQDAVAGAHVLAFLRSGHTIGDVPVSWYWPVALEQPDQLDVVPAPQAGNSLTVRQYRERWLSTFAVVLAGDQAAAGAGCSATSSAPAPGAPGTTVLPGLPGGGQLGPSGSGGIGNTPEPELAEYANGAYPDGALVEVQPGRRLAPRTAAAFVRMRAAAEAAGLRVWITSAYRSQEDQQRIIGNVGLIGSGGLGAPVGDSPHGLGVAVDLDVSGSPGLYAWLVANAGRFCMGNYLSDAIKGREPWHWALRIDCTPES